MTNSTPELTEDIVYDIPFTVFESCDFFTFYAYDAPNDKIEQAIRMLDDKNIQNLVESEIDKDWQDAQMLAESRIIQEDMKHIIRIAMLVKRFTVGHTVRPVSIDTFSEAPSFLEGHHRLLALKYIGSKSFPAYLNGYVDVLEENLHVNMG